MKWCDGHSIESFVCLNFLHFLEFENSGGATNSIIILAAVAFYILCTLYLIDEIEMTFLRFASHSSFLAGFFHFECLECGEKMWAMYMNISFRPKHTTRAIIFISSASSTIKHKIYILHFICGAQIFQTRKLLKCDKM